MVECRRAPILIDLIQMTQVMNVDCVCFLGLVYGAIFYFCVYELFLDILVGVETPLLMCRLHL